MLVSFTIISSIAATTRITINKMRMNFLTHWIVLYALNNDITYFDSSGVEHIPKEIK